LIKRQKKLAVSNVVSKTVFNLCGSWCNRHPFFVADAAQQRPSLLVIFLSAIGILQQDGLFVILGMIVAFISATSILAFSSALFLSIARFIGF
jgi:hypothetical protein